MFARLRRLLQKFYASERLAGTYLTSFLRGIHTLYRPQDQDERVVKDREIKICSEVP